MPNRNTGSSKTTQKTSTNAGTSQSAGQNTSAQPAGQNQQQGHGHAQAHIAAGGHYGQFSVQGSNFGGNVVQSGTSAPGQQTQYPQQIRWHNTLTPTSYQGNTGSTMPQNVFGQPTGHNQQQGHGHAQAHVATGGQHGQFVAMQHVQGGGLGGNAVQVQSGASAPGQQAQYPQNIKWRNTLIPSNYQGTTGQGGSSSTSASGLGTGTGAGANFSTMNTDNFRYHRGGGGPPNRGNRGTGRSRGQRGYFP